MTDMSRLIGLADEAVAACLPVLPLNGSDGAGYRVADSVHATCVAEPWEWATAAKAIADLHRELRR